MELIGAGRASRVFALDADRVLRRSGFDTEGEARLMRLLRREGFPAPEVFDARGGDLVMERLHGPTLAAEMLAGRVAPAETADVLLGLHERLHRIDAPPWLPSASRGVDLTGDGPARVLHLDLHPENVILTEAGPHLVDWANAAAGAPAFDLAVSWVILVGVDLAAYGLPAERIESLRTGTLPRLREAATEAALAEAIRYRRADPNIDESEIDRALNELA
ncbi:phosphotransferase [Glycomyces tenuis]|uniref:phosphotransferase n=1 Tax=Glycomyces tenuis TaxID=58116 RepID=UPI000407D0B1|nr:phosphotransferase [Glycomyces tenuis]